MINYFKKLGIMFVMLLAILGVGVIQNGSVANAATIGQSLTSPESGWKRYDDSDNKIQYDGNWNIVSYPGNYNGSYHIGTGIGNTYVFNFYGSKFRLLCYSRSSSTNDVTINIDKNISETVSFVKGNSYQVIVYEKLNLDLGFHEIQVKTNTNSEFLLDAIDIDKDGYLSDPIESITLDKSSMVLTEGTSEQLTATTTPAGAKIAWTSSDSSIATVDPAGKVTASKDKEGTCTITATTTNGLTAKCTVTVTVTPKPPVDEPTGGEALCIELVDGNIKQYNVSSDEINKFINWYNNRDNDDSQPPYYKFSKGDYKDYVIHDKIVWFEIR